MTFSSKIENALRSLEMRMDYHFDDLRLLNLALTHPSMAQEETHIEHNQRLEFLGDSVLQLILTHALFEKFSNANEGALTKARARLINRRSLVDHARQLDLGQCLQLSYGEEMSGGRNRPSALADAFEALVGAMYLDAGWDKVSQWVLQIFQKELDAIQLMPHLENPKGELQELLHSRAFPSPEYQMEAMFGPDHDPVFVCSVFHEGIELGRGKGKTKKEAEARAAMAALKTLHREMNPDPIPQARKRRV